MTQSNIPAKFDPANARASGPFQDLPPRRPNVTVTVLEPEEEPKEPDFIDVEFEPYVPHQNQTPPPQGGAQTASSPTPQATTVPPGTQTPPPSPPPHHPTGLPPEPTPEQKAKREEIRNVPVNRLLTFITGLIFTLTAWNIVMFFLYLKWGILLDELGKYALLIFFLITIFVAGIQKNATSDGKTAGYVGVVYLFASPIAWKWLQIVVPSGWIWLPPLISQVIPVYIGEQAILIPPHSSDKPFVVVSISRVLFPGTITPEGNKFVPMEVRVQIRKRIINPYRYIIQKPPVIEKTQVDLVVEKIRELAANGVYYAVSGQTEFVVKDDIDLMQKKAELGEALTRDVRATSEQTYGEEIIGVIVPHIEPVDPALVKQYERVAVEMAQRTAQTIEVQNLINIANMIMADPNNPINTFEQAFVFALVIDKKIPYEQIVVKGTGDRATVVPIMPAPGQQPHQSHKSH